MNRTRAFRLILGISATVAALSPAAARSAEPRDAATESAPKAKLLPAPGSPLVALRLILRVGSQNDPDGKEGLAALTAAMVAQGGTKDLAYEQILARLYPMAAALSGDCRKEVTVFSGEVHRDNLARFENLATAMLTEPRFAAEDFERLRNEALDHVSQYLRGGNDEELGKWALQTELYKNHPYGHVDRGTVQGLKAITLDDVKAFHRRYYTRDAIQIGVAGGADREFLEHVQKDLGPLAATGTAPPRLPAPQRPEGLDVTVIEKNTDSTAISLGFPIDVTRADDDFYALAVANSYLGEHRTFNGKLMQDLRGKRGLNYGDYSYVEDFIQDGMSTFAQPNNPRRQQYFSIWLRPVPHEKAVFALRGALWEFDRLLRDGISESDFESTRSYLLNYSKLWVQTLPRRLGFAMDGDFYGRDDLVTELGRRLPTLTVEQVNAAVRRHLKTPGWKIAVVTKNAAALRDALVSGKPSPITYDTEGTAPEVLAEDKLIEAFPLENVRVRIVPVGQVFEK